MRAFLLIVVLTLPRFAAAELVGRVVNVADGDTLTVLVQSKQVKVRLDSIDAPERSQPYGRRSQESLSQLCSKRAARIVEKGVDRYGRTIGVVLCDGVQANSEQVRRGMAWVFDRYVARNSPLYSLQGDARATRRGLWADPRPVAPWDWRRRPKA